MLYLTEHEYVYSMIYFYIQRLDLVTLYFYVAWLYCSYIIHLTLLGIYFREHIQPRLFIKRRETTM